MAFAVSPPVATQTARRASLASNPDNNLGDDADLLVNEMMEYLERSFLEDPDESDDEAPHGKIEVTLE